MSEFKVTNISSSNDLRDKSRVLAKVYSFLLSLPDPGDNNIEPAAEDLGRDAAAGSVAGSLAEAGESQTVPARRSALVEVIEEEGHFEL